MWGVRSFDMAPRECVKKGTYLNSIHNIILMCLLWYMITTSQLLIATRISICSRSNNVPFLVLIIFVGPSSRSIVELLWENYSTAWRARTYIIQKFFIMGCFNFSPFNEFSDISGLLTWKFLSLTIEINSGSGVRIWHDIGKFDEAVRGFSECCDEGFLVQVKDVFSM